MRRGRWESIYTILQLVLVASAVAVAACAITHLLIPLSRRLAAAAGAMDRPGGRRHQPEPVPRGGGLAIVAGIGAASVLAASLDFGAVAEALPARPHVFALAIALIFCLGLFDDLRGLSPPVKLGVQLVAAGALVADGCSFQVLNLPFLDQVGVGPFGALLSLLWIVGVTNAINFVDGLDGLAGGLVAIIAGSLLLYALGQHNPASVILLSAMAGSCLGFLYHNWAPAKIFMGDSGALTLGFLLAATSVHSSYKAPAAVAILVPILALGLPVIDTLLVVSARLFEDTTISIPERLGRILRADRNHVHHLLQHLAPRRWRVVLGLYALAIVFCAMALLVALTRDPKLGFLLLAIQFGVVLAIRKAGARSRARRLARRRREQLRDRILGPAAPDAREDGTPAAESLVR